MSEDSASSTAKTFVFHVGPSEHELIDQLPEDASAWAAERIETVIFTPIVLDAEEEEDVASPHPVNNRLFVIPANFVARFNSQLLQASRCEIGGHFVLSHIVINEGILAIKGSSLYTAFCRGDLPTLRTVTLPNSLAAIGDHFLEGPHGITSIALPPRVVEIGNNFLANNRYLDSLSLLSPPEEDITNKTVSEEGSGTAKRISSSLTRVGDMFLGACSSLRQLNLLGDCPGLTSVGHSFLFGCVNLESVMLPDSVAHCGSYFLGDCRSLRSLRLPQGLTKLERFSLSGCASLTTLSLPNGLTSVDPEVLSGCKSLVSLHLPESLTVMGYDFLSGCTSLATLVVPDNIKMLPRGFLSGCTELKMVQLPADIAVIEQPMLDGCSGLEELQVPPNVALDAKCDKPQTVLGAALKKSDFKVSESWSEQK